MNMLIWLPIIILIVCPLWIRSVKLAKPLFALLCVSSLYAMIKETPEGALNRAPFEEIPSQLISYYACTSAISEVNYCTAMGYGERDGVCFCNNENALASLAYCYATSYPTEIDSFLSMCKLKGNISLTRKDFNNSLQMYYDRARDIPHNHLPSGETIDYPVKLYDEKLSIVKKAYGQFLGNYNNSMKYGEILVLFWIVVFFLASSGNWSKILFPRLNKSFTGPISRTIRSKITLPALAGKQKTVQTPCLRVFDFLAPSRAEVLILCVFCTLVLHLMFRDIKYVPGDTIFDSKLHAYMRYYGVRSGLLASYILPLSILFAGRNNILQWLTRWDYSTFVMLHRWVTRVVIALILVHAIGYSRHIYFPLKNTEPYILFGLAAFVAGLAILVQGLLVLRRKRYEAFLVVHIFLAVIFIGGSFVHVADLYFLWYYYFTACLWAFDRILRLQRLFSFGFPVSQIRLYEDDTLKVMVPIPPGFSAEGGGHCFLHFFQWSCFWQSHPFTYTVVNNNIVFYVKVKDGVTLRLKRYLESHPSKAAFMRVAVEASYGEATPAFRYDSSVFLAGGNGIPGIYAEAIEVAHKTRGSKRIKLIWVVRNYHSLLWFFEELDALRFLPISTEIYVTKPQERFSGGVSDKSALLKNTYTHNYCSANNNNDPVGSLKHKLNHIAFFEGRPKIDKIVDIHVEESPGSTCFVPCGHPLMVDDLRSEVAQKVATSNKRVDYFEQLQVWS